MAILHAVRYPFPQDDRPASLCGQPGGGLISADSHVTCPICLPLIEDAPRNEEAARERVRIRQMALDEARKPAKDFVAAAALRDFAALLEER